MSLRTSGSVVFFAACVFACSSSSSGDDASSAGHGGSSGASAGSGSTSVAGNGGHVATGGGGANASGSGGGSLSDIAKSLDGIRVEDPCGDTPLDNKTCAHVGTTADTEPFGASKSGTLGGETGTTYYVHFHVRGATEPTHIHGGSPGMPANYLVGGTPYDPGTNEANYEYWRISVDQPQQVYYLNAFNADGLAHVIHSLDYQVAIPVAAGSKVSLEVRDENGHLISNDDDVHPDGVDPAPNHGQFVQLNVVSVEPKSP